MYEFIQSSPILKVGKWVGWEANKQPLFRILSGFRPSALPPACLPAALSRHPQKYDFSAAARHQKLNVKISRLSERSFELNLKFSSPGGGVPAQEDDEGTVMV